MIRSIRLSPQWMASSRSTAAQPHKRRNGRRNFQFRSFARIWRTAAKFAYYHFAVGSISHLQRKPGLTGCSAVEEAKGQWPDWAESTLYQVKSGNASGLFCRDASPFESIGWFDRKLAPHVSSRRPLMPVPLSNPACRGSGPGAAGVAWAMTRSPVSECGFAPMEPGGSGSYASRAAARSRCGSGVGLTCRLLSERRKPVHSVVDVLRRRL